MMFYAVSFKPLAGRLALMLLLFFLFYFILFLHPDYFGTLDVQLDSTRSFAAFVHNVNSDDASPSTFFHCFWPHAVLHSKVN